MRRGLAHDHRHAPWAAEPERRRLRGPRSASAAPAPHCPRYATGNGAGALRRLFLSLGKCRRRGNTLPQPPHTFVPASRDTRAADKTPSRPASETEPARVPGLPFRQPLGLRTRNCRRSERPAPPRGSGPAAPRQGDSRDTRLGLGEAQRTAPGPSRPPPRDPAPPGPPRPWPPPRPRRYLPPALPPVGLSAPPRPHARRHRCARAPAPAPPTWAGCGRAARPRPRPARGHGTALCGSARKSAPRPPAAVTRRRRNRSRLQCGEPVQGCASEGRRGLRRCSGTRYSGWPRPHGAAGQPCLTQPVRAGTWLQRALKVLSKPSRMLSTNL